MATLALGSIPTDQAPDAGGAGSEYASLFAAACWDHLAEFFIQEARKVYELPAKSVLEVCTGETSVLPCFGQVHISVLRAGGTAVRTLGAADSALSPARPTLHRLPRMFRRWAAACHEPAFLPPGISSSTQNCVSAVLTILSCDSYECALPPALPQAQSKLICRISGLRMDDQNRPMVLPNGSVYSLNALRDMAVRKTHHAGVLSSTSISVDDGRFSYPNRLSLPRSLRMGP